MVENTGSRFMKIWHQPFNNALSVSWKSLKDYHTFHSTCIGTDKTYLHLPYKPNIHIGQLYHNIPYMDFWDLNLISFCVWRPLSRRLPNHQVGLACAWEQEFVWARLMTHVDTVKLCKQYKTKYTIKSSYHQTTDQQKNTYFLGEGFSSVFLSIISDTATFQGRFGQLVSIESSCFFACQWVRDLQP